MANGRNLEKLNGDLGELSEISKSFYNNKELNFWLNTKHTYSVTVTDGQTTGNGKSNNL